MREPVHPGRDAARGPRRAQRERGGACAAHRGASEPHHSDSQRPSARLPGTRRCASGASSALQESSVSISKELYELRLAERENGAAIARQPTLDAAGDLHAAGRPPPPGRRRAPDAVRRSVLPGRLLGVVVMRLVVQGQDWLHAIRPGMTSPRRSDVRQRHSVTWPADSDAAFSSMWSQVLQSVSCTVDTVLPVL